MGRTTPSAGSSASSNATGAPADTRARTRQLLDDFGRIAATLSPDSGLTTRSFDETDRMTASLDAQGNSATYDYDMMGRIQKQTITDAATKQSTETAWVYSGKRLIEIKHPTQSERYEYDERGLRTAKTVTLHNTAANTPQGQHTAVTRYTYDEAGTLQSTSLPDGSRLVYERNGQGQVTALKRSQLQTPWLQTPWVQRWASWMLPTQTIVQDLNRDLIGLKSYRAGNGIEAHYQRSQNGALARVVYRRPDSRPAKLQTAANPRLPALMGASAQDTIGWLLGAGAAHAVPTLITPVSPVHNFDFFERTVLPTGVKFGWKLFPQRDQFWVAFNRTVEGCWQWHAGAKHFRSKSGAIHNDLDGQIARTGQLFYSNQHCRSAAAAASRFVKPAATCTLHQQMNGLAAQFFQIHLSGFNGRVGEVAEQAINTQTEKLQIFGLRIAFVVECQTSLLVAEGVSVNEQPSLVGVVYQRGGGLGVRVLQVRLPVAVEIAKIPSRVERSFNGHDVRLPRPNAVSIQLDFGKASWCHHGTE